MMRVSPGPRIPSAHGKAVVQAPSFISKWSPGGVGSATDTSAAVDGPPFVTVIVYVAVFPGTTLAGPVFVIARFALRTCVSVSVADTGAGFPNVAGLCAVTVFTSVLPVASGATVATNEKVATAFTGRFTVVSIGAVPLAAVQLPPPAAV